MKESLEKLIRRVVLPKYPWIKDFEVICVDHGGVNIYGVYYYVDDDLYDKPDDYRNSHSTTKNLFSVLGPSLSDVYNDTKFKNYYERIIRKTN
jgi:hypothetical protein